MVTNTHVEGYTVDLSYLLDRHRENLPCPFSHAFCRCRRSTFPGPLSNREDHHVDPEVGNGIELDVLMAWTLTARPVVRSYRSQLEHPDQSPSVPSVAELTDHEVDQIHSEDLAASKTVGAY